MARIRTIKPELFTSLTINSLPFEARWLFVGLLTHCDDAGRCIDEPRVIKGALLALDEDSSSARVDHLLHLLATAGHDGRGPIIRYQVDGRRYIQIRSWGEHQRIDRPSASKLPECPSEPSPPDPPKDHSTNVRRTIDEPSSLERNREQGTGKGTDNPPVELQPALTLVPTDVSPDGDRVQRIFDAWVTATGKQRAQLDAKRRRLINAALKSYPETDVIDAVRGWRNSPHHCGQNDRSTVYNDLGLLLRDAAHIEQFRDLERGHQIGTALVPQLSRNTQFIAARIADARAKEISQ